MSRSSIFFTASFALVVAACGDDSSTGTGGGSASSSATTTASTGGSPTSSSSSSPSSTSSSSSDGGGTSDGGGGSGDGGSGDGGANVGGGGLGGNPSYEELCEYQNDQILGYAEQLDCPATPGSCVQPAECTAEDQAIHDCYYEYLDIEDCDCLTDVNGDPYFYCLPIECEDEIDDYFACEDA